MATMRMFSRYFIIPIARRHKWKSFCEIGAQFGTNIDELLKLSIENYVVIDPCFDKDLQIKYSSDPRVKVLRFNSLDALASSELLPAGMSFDCILIDGDHNWYTVFNELNTIHKRGLLRTGGYVFLHDIEWPYGRRDMYYQPDTIPAQFRHPFAQKGVIRGQSALVETGGAQSAFMNAKEEGGPKNGVLTAVEDFVAEHRKEYRFCGLRYQFGFGILQLRSASWNARFSYFQFLAKASVCNLFGRQAAALRKILVRKAA
jgi:hypothetical protein